jgi:hypothetical protein
MAIYIELVMHMLVQCEFQVDAIHRIPKMHGFLQIDGS